MKTIHKTLARSTALAIICSIIFLCGCQTQAFTYTEERESVRLEIPNFKIPNIEIGSPPSLNDIMEGLGNKPTQAPTETLPNTISHNISLADIPPHKDNPYVEINGNTPLFTSADIITQTFESYGALDSLGRCTAAFACVGKETMPKEERGEIGQIKPTGWHTVKYDGIQGNYLYNRCHLIAHCLTAENANPNNLITGTRYMNVIGMLPFEERVANYIDQTSNHVLYRVTPMFDGNNLVATGVLMEGYSVEDKGAGIEFCIFAYNIQPGITIDYSTGESSGQPLLEAKKRKPLAALQKISRTILF